MDLKMKSNPAGRRGGWFSANWLHGDWAIAGDYYFDGGSWGELAPGKQCLQIDQEKEFNICAVLVWHYHQQARVYFDVVVQVFDDPNIVLRLTLYLLANFGSAQSDPNKSGYLKTPFYEKPD